MGLGFLGFKAQRVYGLGFKRFRFEGLEPVYTMVLFSLFNYLGYVKDPKRLRSIGFPIMGSPTTLPTFPLMFRV